MSTLVAPRSRAAARVNRISVDLDRSSGYLLGKVYWCLFLGWDGYWGLPWYHSLPDGRVRTCRDPQSCEFPLHLLLPDLGLL